METFVIADTHFGHNNIARYSPCRDADSCEQINSTPLNIKLITEINN